MVAIAVCFCRRVQESLLVSDWIFCDHLPSNLEPLLQDNWGIRTVKTVASSCYLLQKVWTFRLHHGDGTCAGRQPVLGALRQLCQLQSHPGHQHRASGNQVKECPLPTEHLVKFCCQGSNAHPVLFSWEDWRPSSLPITQVSCATFVFSSWQQF